MPGRHCFHYGTELSVIFKRIEMYKAFLISHGYNVISSSLIVLHWDPTPAPPKKWMKAYHWYVCLRSLANFRSWRQNGSKPEFGYHRLQQERTGGTRGCSTTIPSHAHRGTIGPGNLKWQSVTAGALLINPFWRQDLKLAKPLKQTMVTTDTVFHVLTGLYIQKAYTSLGTSRVSTDFWPPISRKVGHGIGHLCTKFWCMHCGRKYLNYCTPSGHVSQCTEHLFWL